MKYSRAPLAITHSGQATKPSLMRSLQQRGETEVGWEERTEEGQGDGGGREGERGRNGDGLKSVRRKMESEILNVADGYDGGRGRGRGGMSTDREVAEEIMLRRRERKINATE